MFLEIQQASKLTDTEEEFWGRCARRTRKEKFPNKYHC